MRRKLLYLLGLAALIGATYVFIGRDFDPELFMESFWSIRPLWIGASVIAVFVSYVLRAVRWRTLLKPLKLVHLTSLISATVLGFAAIYAVGRAGEVVRPIWVARQEGIPVTGSFASIVVERVFDTLMILALLAIGLSANRVPGSAEGAVALLSRAAWLLLFVCLSVLAMFAFSHRYVDKIAARIPFQNVQNVFEAFTRGAGPLSEPKNMVIITAHSVVVWTVVALQFWLMLIGLNLNITLPTACLVLAVSALGSLAQIPGIGGGFQAAFVFSTTTFLSVPTETAVAAALLAWLITYIPTLTVGGLYMLWKGISTSDLVEEGS
jgi:uncharacterized protein (TIRG00374 family)